MERKKLSLKQKIILRINGCVFLRWEKRQGCPDYLAIYLVKCKKHGLFENYPHGNANIYCPKCNEEDEKAADIKEKPHFYL